MTRQEVELLIKLRSETEAGFNALNKGLRETAAHAKDAGQALGQTETAIGRMGAAARQHTTFVDLIDAAVLRLGNDQQRAVEQARVYAHAIEEMGGVSKLTADQQKELRAAVNQGIEGFRVMGQELPAHVQKVKNDLDQATGAVNAYEVSVGKMVAGWVAGYATFATAQRAVRATVEFIKGSIAAYAEQERAVVKMTQALHQQGQATPALVKDYRDLASEFQRTTVYGDELWNEMQALLIQVGDVGPAQMTRALQASADLAEGLGIDLRTATLLVGKAFAGSTETLTRYGIVVDEADLKSRGIEAVLEQINEKFGGQAQAAIASYTGQIEQLGNQWDDLKERVGENWANDPMLRLIMRLSKEALEAANATDRHAGAIEQIGIFAASAYVPGSQLAMVLEMLAHRANDAADATALLNSIPSPFAKFVKSGQGQPITAGLALFDEEMKRLEEAEKRAKKAAEERAAALEAIRRAQIPLAEAQRTDIDLLTQQGIGHSDIAKALGVSEVAVRNFVKALEDERKSLKEEEKALQDRERLLEALGRTTHATALKWQQDTAAAAQKTADAHNKSLADMLAAYKEYQRKNTDASQTGMNARVAQIDREHQTAIARLGERTVQNAHFYDQAKDEADRYYAHLRSTAQEIPSFWQTDVVPGVTRQVDLLENAVSGSFAQMLLGAKSFGAGFVDIWRSIKASILNIFTEILNAFTHRLLGGLANALRRSGPGIGQSFAGMFAGWGSAGSGALASTPIAGYTGLAGGGAAGTGGAIGTGGAGAGLGALAGPAAGAGVGFTVGYTTGSSGWGAAAGAGTGAAVGGAFGGPIGAGVGAAVGAAAGAIGGWFHRRGERKKDRAADDEIAALQAQLLNTYGSLDKIREMGELVGVSLEGAWGHRKREGLALFQGTIAEFEAKVAQLQGAMEAYGLTWEDLGDSVKKSTIKETSDRLLSDLRALQLAGADTNTVLTKMAPAFNDLLAAAMRTGQTLPAEMQPVLTQLAEMKLLTEDNVRAMLGLGPTTTVNWQQMEAAAERYKIELDALGPAFQQAKLTDTAKAILADFDMLKASGADVNGVLSGMKEEISELVQESLKFGTEIPENMRPLIEHLVKTGELVDENGDKITDISGLKFGKPLVDEFDKVVEALDRLIEKLDDLAGVDLPPKHQRVELDYPDGYEPADDSERGRPGPGRGAASGIYASGASGVATWFGEGGEPELGGPVDFMASVLAKAAAQVIGPMPVAAAPMTPDALARAVVGALRSVGAAGSADPVHIHLRLRDREIGEALYDIMPDVWRTRGVYAR